MCPGLLWCRFVLEHDLEQAADGIVHVQYFFDCSLAPAVELALSAVLVVAAIIDQTSSRSLADHVTAMYAPYGQRPDPNLLYGLVYTVAAVGALLWLPVIRTVRSRSRSAPVLAVAVTTITAALALLLLVSTEYGAQTSRPCGASWLSCRPPRGPSRLCCSVTAGLVDEPLAALSLPFDSRGGRLA